MRWTAGIFMAAWLSAMMLVAGCGKSDGPQRYSLSGQVTYGGQPVPAGQIVFEPDSSANNKGPQGYADIKDGKYRTEPGKGTVGGPHRVRITGYDGLTTDESKPTKPLFAEYQTKTDLPTADGTKDFEVPASSKKGR